MGKLACLESSPLSHHAFFSVSSGTFLSLLTVPIAEMGQTHNHGLRVGMFFTVVALRREISRLLPGLGVHIEYLEGQKYEHEPIQKTGSLLDRKTGTCENGTRL